MEHTFHFQIYYDLVTAHSSGLFVILIYRLLGTKKVSNGCLLEFYGYFVSQTNIDKYMAVHRDDSERFRRLSILGRIGWWEADFLQGSISAPNMSVSC